jgi:hypothetical protein
MPPRQDIESAYPGAEITKSTETVEDDKEIEGFLCRLGRKVVCLISFLILVVAAVIGISIAFTGNPDVSFYVDS